MTESEDTEKIKVVIIDDDLPSAQLLMRALDERDDIEVCGMAENLAEGERLVSENVPDILFLDMAFPESSGLEWYENTELPDRTKVVFHTCYQRYIHDALSLHVFDFLLKPFEASELEVILSRFKREGRTAPKVAENPALLARPNQSRGARMLAITTIINTKVIVNPDEIVYFRYSTERKLWECVFTNLKRTILKRQTNADLILGYGTDFVRTHKHFIVNMRYVGIISGNDCTLLPPYDNIDEIKISKSYRRELMDRFYDI